MAVKKLRTDMRDVRESVAVIPESILSVEPLPVAIKP